MAPVEWYAAGGVMRLPYDKSGVINGIMYNHVTFKNGKLISGSNGENHTLYIGEPEVLTNVQEQAVLREVEHDLYTAAELGAAEEAGNPIPKDQWTSKMWEIYFAREDGSAVYFFFFNEKYFTKKQAIAVAQSVQFTEAAFQ